MPQIRPQPGPQEKFLGTSADLALYGGAAGGGKTWALLLEPLRHVLRTPEFYAVFFRRTTVQVRNPGGLWDESMKLYGPIPGARPVQQTLEWIFQGGGRVKFAHLEHESNTLDWQGSQVPLLCCEENERVRMANGSLRPVKALRPGDMVMTLQGPRAVIAAGGRRLEDCVRASILGDDGSERAVQTHSVTHKILTARGWQSYADMCGGSPRASSCGSTECRCAHRCAGKSDRKCPSPSPLAGSPSCHPGQQQEPLQLRPGHQSGSVCGADTVQAVPGSGCAASAEQPQGTRPPASPICVSAVLHAPVVPSVGPGSEGGVPRGEEPCALNECIHAGSRDRCSFSQDLCGERAGGAGGNALDGARRRADAEERNQTDWPSGGQGIAQRHTPRRLRYAHPYRGEERTSTEAADFASCVLAPCGKRWVIDLTIAGENHYITEHGLVNQNCFDELTHFTESQFWYLLSRNRSMSGVRPYVRATCNPDADSWVAGLIEWWLDPATGLPIPERSGVLRWFVRVNNALHWASSPEELRKDWPDAEPKSLTFIAATLDDNKALLEADPGYRANLMALPKVDRERLLGGNWRVRADGGNIIREDQWKPWLEAPPTAPDFIVVSLDGAFTEKDENCPSGCSIWHVVTDPQTGRTIALLRYAWRERLQFPDLLERVDDTVTEFGIRGVPLWLVVENKATGLPVIQEMRRRRPGLQIHSYNPKGDKMARAIAVTPMFDAGVIYAMAWKRGESWVFRKQCQMLIDEAAAFPKGQYADLTDTTTMALQFIRSTGVEFFAEDEGPAPPIGEREALF